MECIIPGPNIKVMVKAIQALARIGEELYFQAKADRLSLTALNISRTAYATINLLESFFSSYFVSDADTTDSLDGCYCKVNMKAISSIFKTHRDRNVEICKIEYGTDDKMKITLRYKYDVTMVHSIRLPDSQMLTINIPDYSNGNHLNAPGSFYARLLTMFQIHDEDITWDITKTKAVARNYDTNATNATKIIRTQVSLNPSEFSTFRIAQEASITFALKPFRVAVLLAENFHSNIILSFQISGKPLTLKIEHPTYEVVFILSSINPGSITQSTMSSTPSMPPIPSQNGKTNKYSNITMQDKEAIDSINWDDGFDTNTESTKAKASRRDIDEILANSGIWVDKKSPDNDNSENGNLDDVVPGSPESPRSKRAKLIFKRCFEPTFHQSAMELGDVLAPSSDIESD